MIIAVMNIIQLDDELYVKAYEKVPQYRKEKADKLKNRADQKRSIAAGVLLNEAVRMYEQRNKKQWNIKQCNIKQRNMELCFGKQENMIRAADQNEDRNVERNEDQNAVIFIDVQEAVGQYDTFYDYPIEYRSNGKPGFTGEGTGICFNLSHSGDYVVCAVSSLEVGIDIEGDRKVSDKVAKRFFTQKEYDWIYNEDRDIDERDTSVSEERSHKEYEQNLRFYRIWTLKEAYAKVTGKGIAYGIGEIGFTPKEQVDTRTEFNILSTAIAGSGNGQTNQQPMVIQKFKEQLIIEDEQLRKQYNILQYQIGQRYVVSVIEEIST